MGELRLSLQQYLIDLNRVPFIRDNALYKTFLEINEHYIEESDFQSMNRQFQSMSGAGSYPETMSSNFSSVSSYGRSSVMPNPFSGQNKNNLITMNKMKSLEGRRSVTPSIGNEGQNSLINKKMGMEHQYQSRDFIQELDDEDHSSFASKNRISQIMQMADDMSNRHSVFSVKPTHESIVKNTD